jgi:hypothetical protein
MIYKAFNTLILSAFCLTSALAQSLPVDPETEKVAYEEILNQEGSDKELYKRALAWFDKFYPNARVVIREREPEIGKITAKHKFMLQIPDKKGVMRDVDFIKYSLKVWVKDNKFRYLLTDINVEHTVYYGIEQWMDPAHEDAENNPAKLQNIDKYFQELIESLKERMEPEEAEKDEDDW